MSFETLFQAEILRAQRAAADARASHVDELRATRPAPRPAGGAGWVARHLAALPRRHRGTRSLEGAGLAG